MGGFGGQRFGDSLARVVRCDGRRALDFHLPHVVLHDGRRVWRFQHLSTFAWDTLRLWQDGGWALAVTNVAVSVVGCVAVSWWVAQITS